MKLFGRLNEVNAINAHFRSDESKFILIQGRRRVGKTFLVSQMFKNNLDFELIGLADASMKQQLGQFYSAITKYAPKAEFERVTDWFMAFEQLIRVLEEKKSDRKKVIFVDELPWLDSRKSKFLPALENFWNDWASKRNDIFLIVSGSSVSWMDKTQIQSQITDQIKLKPFTLLETEEYLLSRKVVYDRYQILQLYMVLGGIPFYLNAVDPGLSAVQNINALCFDASAPFRKEFDGLYASLFNKHKRHVSVIRALASKNKGLNRDEIAMMSRMANGGGLTRILSELEESGFIRKYCAFGKKGRNSLYQLIDLYSLFYLRFIHTSSTDHDNFWGNLINTSVFNTWGGFAFEIVCLHHVDEIKQTLGISGVQTSVSTWSSANAQINLIIDRKDQVINVCEMKFSTSQYLINKQYAEVLRDKMSAFKLSVGTKKTLSLTTITTFGIEQNMNSEMVQNDLTIDMLFRK